MDRSLHRQGRGLTPPRPARAAGGVLDPMGPTASGAKNEGVQLVKPLTWVWNVAVASTVGASVDARLARLGRADVAVPVVRAAYDVRDPGAPGAISAWRRLWAALAGPRRKTVVTHSRVTEPVAAGEAMSRQ